MFLVTFLWWFLTLLQKKKISFCSIKKIFCNLKYLPVILSILFNSVWTRFSSWAARAFVCPHKLQIKIYLAFIQLSSHHATSNHSFKDIYLCSNNSLQTKFPTKKCFCKITFLNTLLSLVTILLYSISFPRFCKWSIKLLYCKSTARHVIMSLMLCTGCRYE